MADSGSPITKPEVVFIEELLDEIARGNLRVPRFQRPFVWKPQDMLDLFDSIYRQYPIGSLLFWETSEPINSLDRVGPIQIPDAEGSSRVYILDGHQRLATLFGALMLPRDFPNDSKQQHWQWWIWFDLKNQKFNHTPQKATSKTATSLFPLRAVLKTKDFLDQARIIQERAEKQSSEYIDKAEELAQIIKNYKIPITRIKGGKLDQAVKIFSRLNNQGIRITPDQMVSALTYSEGAEEVHLAERIDGILERLSAYHFGNLSRLTVFQAIVSAANRQIHKGGEWEYLAKTIKSKAAKSADMAEESLSHAARFLHEEIGALGDRLLPYSHQILMLAKFFSHCPHPSQDQKDGLIRWFWATSLSGWFAGINTTKLNKGLAEMRKFAKGEIHQFKVISLKDPARPFPLKFDLRSARIKALLVFILTLKPLDPKTGASIPGEKILYGYGTPSLPYVFSTVKGDGRSSPANRIFLERKPNIPIKKQLMSVSSKNQQQVLESHGITDEAFEALKKNETERFIELRAEQLAKLEREFMEKIGVNPPEEPFGETDIDSD